MVKLSPSVHACVGACLRPWVENGEWGRDGQGWAVEKLGYIHAVFCDLRDWLRSHPQPGVLLMLVVSAPGGQKQEAHHFGPTSYELEASLGCIAKQKGKQARLCSTCS